MWLSRVPPSVGGALARSERTGEFREIADVGDGHKHEPNVRAGVEQREEPLSEEARHAGHRDDDFIGHGP